MPRSTLRLRPVLGGHGRAGFQAQLGGQAALQQASPPGAAGRVAAGATPAGRRGQAGSSHCSWTRGLAPLTPRLDPAGKQARAAVLQGTDLLASALLGRHHGPHLGSRGLGGAQGVGKHSRGWAPTQLGRPRGGGCSGGLGGAIMEVGGHSHN